MKYSILCSHFKPTFNSLQKDLLIDRKLGLRLFVEHLKYIRDAMLLLEYETEELTANIVTIMTAIAEFDAYELATSTKQRGFHWNNFCELIKQNMEVWLTLNDSI